MSLNTILAGSSGNNEIFQSGSTQNSLASTLSAGTFYVEQTENTASIDISGSAVSVGNRSGITFSQDLFTLF